VVDCLLFSLAKIVALASKTDKQASLFLDLTLALPCAMQQGVHTIVGSESET
jgi:hypothetical protein